MNEVNATIGDRTSYTYDLGGQTVADILHTYVYEPNVMVHSLDEQGSTFPTEFSAEDKAAINAGREDRGTRLHVGRGWKIPLDVSGFDGRITNWDGSAVADPTNVEVRAHVVKYHAYSNKYLVEANTHVGFYISGAPAEYFDMTTKGYVNCTLRAKMQEVLLPQLKEYFGNNLFDANTFMNALFSSAVNDEGRVSGTVQSKFLVELPSTGYFGVTAGNGNPIDTVGPLPSRWLYPHYGLPLSCPMREIAEGGKLYAIYGGTGYYTINNLYISGAIPSRFRLMFYFLLKGA